MDFKQLNTTISQMDNIVLLCDLVLQNMAHIDDDTLNLVIERIALLTGGKRAVNADNDKIAELTLAFVQVNKISLDQFNAIVLFLTNVSSLIGVPFKLDGTTLKNVYFNFDDMMPGGDAFYAHVLYQNVVASHVVRNMYENKTIMNHVGFCELCRYIRGNTLRHYMDSIFDIGYGPHNKAIDYLLVNQNNVKSCLIYMVKRFDMKLTDKQLKKCEAKGIYLTLDAKNMEDMFLKNKIITFRKLIPKETKLTQQCLYNACLLPKNISTIRALINKYGLKIDTKCLELSTNLKKNNKVNSYLVNNGVKISVQCIFNIIDNADNYKKCVVYNAWKTQCNGEDVPQIQGICDGE